MKPENTSASAIFADQSIGATVRIVVESILARIRSETFAADERLPSERTLASELGVARNTVREALEVLDGLGVIRRRAGSGSFVVGTQEAAESQASSDVAAETSPLDLQVMRGILEPDMVRLAIVNMAPRRIEELGKILSDMEDVQTDAGKFARLEDEFHRQLAAGTGNPLLIACYDLVIQARRQSFRAALNKRHLTPNRIRDFQRRYNSLFNAITARDIETASEFMKLQLVEEQKILLQSE
jgi:GntR family transcriptional regulator, transcriptional repressor for pyruvate dehydrogenase complex